MMRVEIYKLFREGPIVLHIGLRRMDRTSHLIHSDTLFSALSNSLFKIFDEDKFNEFEEKLIISSVFPGLRGTSKDILFLPMPNIPINMEDEKDHKKYKRFQWISWNGLKELLKYYDKDNEIIHLKTIENLKPMNSKFLISIEEYEELKEFREKDENIIFMETNLEPKVSIPRVPIISEEKTQGLYFQENLEFYTITTSKGKKLIPFLYFLKTKDASLDEIFIPALNLFIEEGIGGERSTGKGQFDFYEKDELDLPDDGDLEITLSLSLPRREEVNNIIYFNLVKRDGFIYYQKPTGYRKKTHFKIGEGSLVRTPYIGENIDVSPIKDMRVISYGKSIGWKFS
jgi:CRISPR-associated protein Csm4